MRPAGWKSEGPTRHLSHNGAGQGDKGGTARVESNKGVSVGLWAIVGFFLCLAALFASIGLMIRAFQWAF